jgi:outer membrane protein
MKIIRIAIPLCITVLLFSTNGFIFAVENTPFLTLNKCFSLAEKKSEGLMMQNEHKAQANQRVKEYKGNILPVVGYTYTKTYLDTGGGLYQSDLNDAYFSFAQPLFIGLRDFKAYKQAKNQVETEAYIYEDMRRDLKIQVTTAFYCLILVNADIENLHNSGKILENRMSELAERVRLGKSRDSEILMVQSQMAGLKAQEESDNGIRANAVEDLAFLTGLQTSDILVKDEIPAVNSIEPLEIFTGLAINRSDIKAAKNNVVSQTYSLQIAKGAHLPTLNLLAYWYTQRSSSNRDSDWQSLITLNFPLFQGGSVQAKVVEETSRLREFQDRLSLVTRETESQINKLYQQAVSSIKQQAAYKSAYEKTVKSYEMQLKDYRHGLVNNLEVLQSVSVMLDTKRSLDRSIIQSKVNIILLEIAASKQ